MNSLDLVRAFIGGELLRKRKDLANISSVGFGLPPSIRMHEAIYILELVLIEVNRVQRIEEETRREHVEAC